MKQKLRIEGNLEFVNASVIKSRIKQSLKQVHICVESVMPQAYKKTMKFIGSFALNIYMQLRKSFLKEGKKYFFNVFLVLTGLINVLIFLSQLL